jgi:hypothetical protein
MLVLAGPAAADDLTGETKILCTVMQANECRPDDGCLTGAPWNYNIPLFVELDLDAKTISTTKASGEKRSTLLKNIQRDGELLILQGYENGRAFSFIVSEPTGVLTVSVAVDDGGMVVFGACTPR